MTNFAQDLTKMMAAWETIMTAAREQFPTATEEEIYQITKGAMAHTLKMN